MAKQLPPIVHQTVNLLNGPQTIEFGIVDGVLKAMVCGFSDFIIVNPRDRLRVEITGQQSVNAIANIATYRIVPDDVN